MENIYFYSQAEKVLDDIINNCYSNSNSIFILCDTHTHTLCMPVLLSHFPALEQAPVIVIPAGETHKNIDACTYIWQQLLQKQADIHSLLLCLGGGMVCDIGGFTAATYKRGIRHVLIPTTLMAQVDAAIGGKTGINFLQAKNQIGIHAPSTATCLLPYFMDSLPEQEVLSGYAEMLKHGLIADSCYWQQLISIPDTSHITHADYIKQSVHIKNQICQADPYDREERRKLNFGHTIGHAIEAYALQHNTPLTHGHAVALGCIAECYISALKGYMLLTDVHHIKQVFRQWYPAPAIPEQQYDNIIQLMQYDKKRQHTHLNCSLLKGIGECIVNQQINQEEITEALRYCLG